MIYKLSKPRKESIVAAVRESYKTKTTHVREHNEQAERVVKVRADNERAQEAGV